jgi:hypothetical protein
MRFIILLLCMDICFDSGTPLAVDHGGIRAAAQSKNRDRGRPRDPARGRAGHEGILRDSAGWQRRRIPR